MLSRKEEKGCRRRHITNGDFFAMTIRFSFLGEEASCLHPLLPAGTTHWYKGR